MGMCLIRQKNLRSSGACGTRGSVHPAKPWPPLRKPAPSLFPARPSSNLGKCRTFHSTSVLQAEIMKCEGPAAPVNNSEEVVLCPLGRAGRRDGQQ